jgi:hypothetical protein
LARDISGDGKSPQSDAMIALIGPIKLHCDFETTSANGGNSAYGVPYNVAPGTQPFLPVTDLGIYSSDGDPGPFPYYTAMSIENQFPNIPAGTPPTSSQLVSGVDYHGLVYVRNESTGGLAGLYEGYKVYSNDGGSNWGVTSIQVHFDLNTGAPRPQRKSSCDAAGLPIAPLLLHYDEVDMAVNHGRPIKHAIRGIIHGPISRNTWIWPARHCTTASGNGPDSGVGFPMGTRIRMTQAYYDANKASYNPVVRAVVDCLRYYGMIIADNNGSLFIDGTNDERWNHNDLVSTLNNIPAGAFEVIDNIYSPFTLSGPTSGAVNVSQTFTIAYTNSLDSNFSANVYMYYTPPGGSRTYMGNGTMDDNNRSFSAAFTPSVSGVYTITNDYAGDLWMAPVPSSITFTVGGPTSSIGQGAILLGPAGAVGIATSVGPPPGQRGLYSMIGGRARVEIGRPGPGRPGMSRFWNRQFVITPANSPLWQTGALQSGAVGNGAPLLNIMTVVGNATFTTTAIAAINLGPLAPVGIGSLLTIGQGVNLLAPALANGSGSLLITTVGNNLMLESGENFLLEDNS